MNTNDLNRKLLLEAPQRTPDGAGGFTVTWVLLGTLWGNIRAATGREASGEAVSLSKTMYRITIRAVPFGAPSRPTPGQRFRDNQRIFEIEAVAERESGERFLTCFCKEEVVV